MNVERIPVPQPTPPSNVVITLTEQEAKHLAQILNHSGVIWDSRKPALYDSSVDIERTSYDLWLRLRDAGCWKK